MRPKNPPTTTLGCWWFAPVAIAMIGKRASTPVERIAGRGQRTAQFADCSVQSWPIEISLGVSSRKERRAG
jgi:hypothetical protein